jgi:murein DD-endopeptidase MepM/ murein hydrolase activator NlpD
MGGAIILDAAVKGDSIGNVVRGIAQQQPIGGGSSTGGGTTSGGSASVSGGGPLPTGATWERTDQGVDASATPGSPVKAIVSGVVSMIVPNWYQGQPAVYITSSGLPGGATGIYYAEQISPNVHVGQQVSAGQTIGTVAGSGTGLEIGFLKGARTLAQATTGYAEGAVTGAGQLMHQFLANAGVKL